jgi:hypothetical protein
MEYCNTRTLLLTNSGALPKYSQQSSFISVQEAGFKGSDVSTCTYKQQDYSQQNLKFENGRHSEASNAPHCFYPRRKRCLIINILIFAQWGAEKPLCIFRKKGIHYRKLVVHKRSRRAGQMVFMKDY